MIDLKKTKEMIREMKADHIFSKSEATQLSILVDRVTCRSSSAFLKARRSSHE